MNLVIRGKYQCRNACKIVALQLGVNKYFTIKTTNSTTIDMNEFIVHIAAFLLLLEHIRRYKNTFLISCKFTYFNCVYLCIENTTPYKLIFYIVKMTRRAILPEKLEKNQHEILNRFLIDKKDL